MRTFSRDENREFLRRAQERNRHDNAHWVRITAWFAMKHHEDVFQSSGAWLAAGHTVGSLKWR